MTLPPPPNLARIPAGEFLMGAAGTGDPGDPGEDDRPVHRVYVSEFLIGRCPVTQDEYARFVRATGHPPPAVRSLPRISAGGREALFKELAAAYVWDDGAPPPGRGSHPVVLVTCEDAVAYCQWMSETLGRGVRLPTEAEWEKAARGRTEGLAYPWGEDLDPSRANFLVDPAVKSERGTTPVGSYPPNPYGLHDMAGNAWEWVSDWYGRVYYATSEPSDPRGPREGHLRIVRGGSWVSEDAGMLRCSYRHKVPPDTYAYSIGFRIVCSAA
jgi:sulfatase modifying factor 1